MLLNLNLLLVQNRRPVFWTHDYAANILANGKPFREFDFSKDSKIAFVTAKVAALGAIVGGPRVDSSVGVAFVDKRLNDEVFVTKHRPSSLGQEIRFWMYI